MKEKKVIATISTTVTHKSGAAFEFEGSIEGNPFFIMEAFGNICEEMINSGFELEDLKEKVEQVAEKMSGNNQSGEEEDDEIPDEVKAGIAILHSLGIL